MVNDSRTENSKVSIVPFSGIVYCVEIPSHGIIIRRNGKTLITHNCSPFEHSARAMSNEEYFSFIKGKYPTTTDKYGILNYETYPFVTKEMNWYFIGINPNSPDIYGWCNNFRGFIPYRYLIENEIIL